jgi:predicted transcriptional regulator of viral defense system
MKYMKDFVQHFSSFPVFTISDARLFLTDRGASREYVYLLITNLLRSGRIKKLKRGFYTFRDDPMLAGFAFSPSYHGLQDALSLHNLWEQETNTIIITPRRVRSGMREILGGNVLVRRINRSMFFGFGSMKYSDLWINVSDIEKTLIDFIYFNEPLDKATIHAMRGKIDAEKMKQYLGRCPERVRAKVLKLLGVKM